MSTADTLHRDRHRPDLGTVLVTGAGGALGRRVLSLLGATGAADLIGVDDVAVADELAGARYEVFDIMSSGGRLQEAMAAADVVVHLAYSTELGDQPLLREVLDAAARSDVRHVVLVSSAMVYGAWPGNAVPLSEDATLRPNPECDFAVRKADAERILWEWSDDHADRLVTCLRPAAAVSGTDVSMIGQAVLAAAPIRTGRDDPPIQFVHLDDLASAVTHCVVEGVGGTYNVAADGWLTGDELRALLGARLRVRLPFPTPDPLDRLIARRTRKPVPAGLLAYTRYPWAVANDALRATGWRPRYGNDQAFVAADDGAPWDSMNARQRQYWSLGIGAALIGGAIGLTIWLVRRARRGRVS